MDVTSTLLAKKSKRVTRAMLAAIPAPPMTATWRPVAHGELMDILQAEAEKAGYRFAREQYAIQKAEGLKLFGTIDLEGGPVPGQGLTTAIGLRHGNDKSLAINLVAGARVMVCDNLALVGDLKLFRNKHKHGVFERLRDSLKDYFDKLGGQIDRVRERFDFWRATALTDADAKVLIYDAIAGGIIPSRLRPDVHVAYFDAEKLGYEDSAPRTKLGLHNAFTRAIKLLNPAPAYEANLGLTRLLGTGQEVDVSPN